MISRSLQVPGSTRRIDDEIARPAVGRYLGMNDHFNRSESRLRRVRAGPRPSSR